MFEYKTIFENDTIELSQGKNGFWLYDQTRGMNLSMKAPSEQQAFADAVMYYQNRLMEVEKDYLALKTLVETFVKQINYDDAD
jgi:hypothetical protein